MNTQRSNCRENKPRKVSRCKGSSQLCLRVVGQSEQPSEERPSSTVYRGRDMAWSRSGGGDWRQQIYNNLRERNKKEYENISDLIQLHEMGTRIDDLERNIADLMTQAGPEEVDK